MSRAWHTLGPSYTSLFLISYGCMLSMTQALSPLFAIVSVSILLLRRDTMTMATLVKEDIELGLASSSEVSPLSWWEACWHTGRQDTGGGA